MEQGIINKIIKIGNFPHIRPVYIGGDYAVVVQTMWKDHLSFSDLQGVVGRIEALGALGCGLLRFAVPDIESADVLGCLSGMVSMPLCADIHFDYKIALRCMDFPVSKIRINPGNIGDREKIRAVLEKAAHQGIPIRIGVNAGSLPLDLREKVEQGFSACEALVQAAQREISLFEDFGFNDYLVSMKASTIADTINANKILRLRAPTILHVGVTEAGPLTAGVVRNTAALLNLLAEGIGDTIRVSLSDTMENEVIAGREIITAAAQLAPENARLKSGGVNIISCPRCGRYGFDTHGFTSRWLQKFYALDRDITVAIMGCEVNGPIEAKHADLGITGVGEKVLIFKNGKVIKTITAVEADAVFEEELKSL
jgi:(E)-4-hydroxy-3-methylbut-2-enyl-diphosphate synthase